MVDVPDIGKQAVFAGLTHAHWQTCARFCKITLSRLAICLHCMSDMHQTSQALPYCNQVLSFTLYVLCRTIMAMILWIEGP